MSGIKHSQRRYHQTSKSHSTKAEVDILGKKIWAKNQLRKAVSKARTVIAGTSPQLDSQSHAPKKQTPASSPKKTPAPSSGTANETPRKSTSQGTKSETATSKKPRSTTVGDLTFELYKDHAVLVKCVNSEATEVEIPGDVENRPMTVIGEHAFKDCTHLSATSIPTSVVELQRSAFEGCTAIKRLELPSDLKVIGPRAFADCSSLEEILLPFELTSIGESAFENCRRLSAIPHFVKQGVGADNHVADSTFEVFANGFFLAFLGAPRQKLYPHAERHEQIEGLFVVLPGENFRRRHKKGLMAGGHTSGYGEKGDDGFTASYIALHQSLHAAR